jgi:hypothetical protein
MSDAFLNVTLKILAFSDRQINSNPRLRLVDWNRDTSGTVVKNPKTEAYSIDPGATKLIFDGTRTTTIGPTTAFNVTLSPLDPSRYRIAWVAGQNPGFRLDRLLTLSGVPVTVTLQQNNTAIFSVPMLSVLDFTGVNPGDTLLIPSSSTGDSLSPFSTLNSGKWQVLGVTSIKSIIVARSAGNSFEGTSEIVTPTANSQIQAFSTSGVQVSDKLDISAGFSPSTRKTFEIVAVSSTYIEVISTSPLPPELNAIPGIGGMLFYTDSKIFLYVETDQESSIRLNGSTDNSQRLSPVEPGNQDRPAIYLKNGPTYSLSIVNRSATTMNAIVVHAE